MHLNYCYIIIQMIEKKHDAVNKGEPMEYVLGGYSLR